MTNQPTLASMDRKILSVDVRLLYALEVVLSVAGSAALIGLTWDHPGRPAVWLAAPLLLAFSQARQIVRIWRTEPDRDVRRTRISAIAEANIDTWLVITLLLVGILSMS